MIIFIILLGLVIGSFINMLVWRLHHGTSLGGRSFCDKTKEVLEPIDLIPIFSYIFFKGKCRKCGAKLPIKYPLVELASALVASLTYVRIEKLIFPMSYSYLDLFVYLIVTLIIVYILFYFAVYDLNYWEVEVRSLIFAFLIILILVVINQFYPISFLPTITSALLGGLAGAFLIGSVVLATKGAGMGIGDIFLFGLSGMIVGIEGLWWTFMITVLTGSFIGIFVLIVKRKVKGILIQFAPLISFGTVIVFLYKSEILEIIQRMMWA